jgi:hypothetical protein
MNFIIYTLQYHKGVQIKEDEIYEACRMHEETKKYWIILKEYTICISSQSQCVYEYPKQRSDAREHKKSGY